MSRPNSPQDPQGSEFNRPHQSDSAGGYGDHTGSYVPQYETQPGQPGQYAQPGQPGQYSQSVPPPVPPSAAQPEKKKKGGCFKWGGIAAGVIIVLGVLGGLINGGDNSTDSDDPMRLNADSSVSSSEELENADFTAAPESSDSAGSAMAQDDGGAAAQADEGSVPAEYKNALRKAKVYSDMMHMSKAGIYDQLTSEYGEQFSPEAAQYAMDNLKADWNKNALEKARTYQESMAMSPDAIYDQLTSEYGEQFTAEEAQYAVDNL